MVVGQAVGAAVVVVVLSDVTVVVVGPLEAYTIFKEVIEASVRQWEILHVYLLSKSVQLIIGY